MACRWCGVRRVFLCMFMFQYSPGNTVNNATDFYKSFESNIRKANKQLSSKIAENEFLKKGSLGIISVNLTNVFDRKEYLDLLTPIMENFVKHHQYLGSNDVLSDKNFNQIHLSMLQGLLEFKFWEMFGKFKCNNYKFHKSIKGIFYQVDVMIPIFNSDRFFVTRAATYFPFDNDLKWAKFLFHPLAVGV